MGWYWYSPRPNQWLRCTCKNNLMGLLELEIILTGERVSGRGRRAGMDWVLDKKNQGSYN
jgi:hypothetical protein